MIASARRFLEVGLAACCCHVRLDAVRKGKAWLRTMLASTAEFV